jgi:hypothetical protein
LTVEQLRRAQGELIKHYGKDAPLRDITVGSASEFEQWLIGWPKPWVNLRSTRRTELEAEFPHYVINRWLGHSSRVAEKHYLAVTSEHIEKATGRKTKAVHNPVQYPAATPRTTANRSQRKVVLRGVKLLSATQCEKTKLPPKDLNLE